MTSKLLAEPLQSVSISTSRVDAATAALIHKAISSNTKRTYRSALNRFLQWNANENPFNDRNVAEYLSYLYHFRNLAPASIAIAFSAIKRLARQAGILTEWKYTTETLAGMRRSEVANLRWGDILEANNDLFLVQVRCSKSNQEGHQDYRLLKGQGAQSVNELRKEIQPSSDDLVIPLTCKQIANRFQACCAHAGLSGKFTAHSGRIGLASELITRGANTGSVALAGGWKSERMVLHYSQQARTEQGAVAKYL